MIYGLHRLHRFQRTRRRRAAAGLTLVELLVVMGILIAFTYMAIRLLSGGLAVWKIAEESRDHDERARAALDLIRQDLFCCDGSEASRFVADYGDVPFVDVKNAGEPMTTLRLRFVRTMSRADDARLRGGFANKSAPAPAGGDTAASGASPAQTTEGGGNTAPEPRPNIGLLEIAYACAPDPAARDAPLLQLRRATVPADLSPPEPGVEQTSVFAKDFFTKQKNGFMDDNISGEVIAGVLHFSAAFASQRTKSLDKKREEGGGESSWDSTRGLYLTPKAAGWNKFTFALDVPAAPRARVFPRRVRILLMLSREDADRRVVRLAKDADPRAVEFVLDDPKPLSVSPGEFVKIGSEMLEVSEAGPRSLRVRGRGALGTRAGDHRAESAVQLGRIFTFEAPLDAARDAQWASLR